MSDNGVPESPLADHRSPETQALLEYFRERREHTPPEDVAELSILDALEATDNAAARYHLKSAWTAHRLDLDRAPGRGVRGGGSR